MGEFDRYMRRGRAEPKWKTPVRIGLLIFGLLVIAAVLIDMKAIQKSARQSVTPDPASDIQNILLGLDGEKVADPKGFFTIVPPAGWKIVPSAQEGKYNLGFYGPYSVSINIEAMPVDYNDFPALLKKIEDNEKQFGINMNIKPTRFNGRRAVERTTRLYEAKVVTIDFVEDHVGHHIICSMPPEFYDKYRPVLFEVLKSYEPVKKGTAE